MHPTVVARMRVWNRVDTCVRGGERANGVREAFPESAILRVTFATVCR